MKFTEATVFDRKSGAAEGSAVRPGSRTKVSVPLVLPQNRHPACPGLPWERSASQIDRVTRRLWRGVEGPRQCLSYPCCSELLTHQPPLCYPERTRISYFAALTAATCAALRKESRMKSTEATVCDRKSGAAGICNSTLAHKLALMRYFPAPRLHWMHRNHVAPGPRLPAHGIEGEKHREDSSATPFLLTASEA
jgi:hypothetical protein